MEKIDLRELNKMTKSFRAIHRALVKLKDGEDFYMSFVGTYRRDGMPIPIVDGPNMRNYIVSSLEGELSALRFRLNKMGIDLLDIASRKGKKVKLKVAK
jgi:hypothetical protein